MGVKLEHIWSDVVEVLDWFYSKISPSAYRSQSPAAPGAQGTTSGKHSNREDDTTGSQPPPKRKLAKKNRGTSAEESASDNSDLEDTGNKKRKTSNVDEPRLLACPFFKNNPKRYCRKRSCAGPGFRSVARVKEHIYRCHQLPENKCNRCCQVFGSALELLTHQRNINPCDIRIDDVCEGIDANTKAQLQSKKRGPKLTEAERWLAMYRILFPNVSNLPDPYCIHLNSQLDSLEDYSQYLLKELPCLVRQGLPADNRDPDLICERIYHALADSLNPQLYYAFREARETTASGSSAEILSGDHEIDLGMQEATPDRNTNSLPLFERHVGVQEDFPQIQPSFSFDSLSEFVETEADANFMNRPFYDLLGLDSEFAVTDLDNLVNLPAYDPTTRTKTDSGYDTSEQT